LLQNGQQPAVTPNGRLFLFLDGEIYNLDELALRYRDDLPPNGDGSAMRNTPHPTVARGIGEKEFPIPPWSAG
jgi:hypothetical protein